MRFRTIPILTMILANSGCAMLGGSKDTIHVVERGGLDIHALPSGYISVITRDNASTEKVCSGRMPDALLDKTVSLGAGGTAGLGSASIGSGSNELALGGRSPDVLIIRETLFRLCELSLNQNLSPEDTVALFRETFPLLIQALKSDVPGSKAVGSSSESPAPEVNQMQSHKPPSGDSSYSTPSNGSQPGNNTNSIFPRGL